MTLWTSTHPRVPAGDKPDPIPTPGRLLWKPVEIKWTLTPRLTGYNRVSSPIHRTYYNDYEDVPDL